MPARIKQSRGDVYLGNLQNFPEGQLFWSYVHTTPENNNPHSYSEGQLWIKDPSSEELTEVSNRRSLNAATFKGFITPDFRGDFVNASETTQHDFLHCHKGDFWIFDHKDTTHFNYEFNKGDILLITNTTYINSEHKYRYVLANVEYIRIPGGEVDKTLSDLEADTNTDAITELEQRFVYKGVFSTLNEYYNLPRKKGWAFMSLAPVAITVSELIDYRREWANGEVAYTTKKGDFICWNGSKWVLMPTGWVAKDVPYTPNSTAIDNVITFEDFHKTLLKGATNVQEALDILNTQKAGLDEHGKIPYSELPESVVNSMCLMGKFYPIANPTGNPDLANNQNPWPPKVDIDGTEVEDWMSGWFWIVDTQGKTNVQYHDKEYTGRVLELNSGDFIVYVGATHRFEVIDNSDRVAAIEVTYPDKNGQKVTLLGNIGLTTDGKVKIRVSDNTIILDDSGLISQDPNGDGREHYFPIYTGNRNELTNSELHQEGDKIISELSYQINGDFTVGDAYHEELISFYGDPTVKSTTGSTTTSYINHSYDIESKFLNRNSRIATRYTQIYASELNRFAESLSDEINLILPDASGTLLAKFKGDKLTPTYHTKTNKDGFLTDTLVSEQYTDLYPEDREEGFENIGIGRTTSEDVDTGEITFYAKTKDEDAGFYVNGSHNVMDEKGEISSLLEHFLNRNNVGKTHLVINPTVRRELLETFVKMPAINGTLYVWEDYIESNNGVPLMIPAWEEMHSDVHDYVGLDTSPITIKINRPKTGRTSVDRTNDLSHNYGAGTKSTWSYINSNKAGSLQDDERGSIDDVVEFDSWLESQRSIATNEAFIIPSTATLDGGSHMNPFDLTVTRDTEETKNDNYGRNKLGGKYQRILPSRSIYKDSEQYYDWHTGQLIPQNDTNKDVEMPSVGGVLLTDRSTIRGGFFPSR